jgi:SAM-dependent methyltransferase
MDPGTGADLAGLAEAIPVRGGEAGLVMCTQVLEHVDRPERAVAEMARVLAPSGACLLTTHGTWFYHPDPEDYWRWTSAGLRRLFERAGHSHVRIRPVGGTRLALAALAITALDRAPGGGLRGTARRALVGPANALAGRLFLDPEGAERDSVPGELALNYLVTSRKY